MIVSTRHKRKFNEDLLTEPFETKLFLGKDKGTTPEALHVLADDRSWYVRYFVAGNPNASIETLKKLYEDKDFRIKDNVENNQVWKKYKEEHSVNALILDAGKRITGKTREECKQVDKVINR